jgi:hypothetical protein
MTHPCVPGGHPTVALKQRACPSCQWETDWWGRLSWVGCVRCEHPAPDFPMVDPGPRVIPNHGFTGYGQGCRCWRCKKARADWYKQRCIDRTLGRLGGAA